MKKNQSKLQVSLILPCYNEFEHIADSLKKISSYLTMVLPAGFFEIILIDDGSVDGTRNFLKKLEPSDQYRIEFNEANLGRGGAVKRGLELASGEITGFMDIDREVSEVYLPAFIKRIQEGADLVLGSRTYNWTMNPFSLSRHIASVGYRKLTKLPLSSPVHDSEVGYKFFSKRARDAILKTSHFNNWFWDSECVQIALLNGFKISEVPVLFIRNPKKTSTVNLFPDILQYLKAIAQFKKLKASGVYNLEKR